MNSNEQTDYPASPSEIVLSLPPPLPKRVISSQDSMLYYGVLSNQGHKFFLFSINKENTNKPTRCLSTFYNIVLIDPVSLCLDHAPKIVGCGELTSLVSVIEQLIRNSYRVFEFSSHQQLFSWLASPDREPSVEEKEKENVV